MKALAQGIASLGRGNDTMLVHMSPQEVQGLQKLALAAGGSLTTNPHTGLPEAGFLSSILPMIGGAALMMIPGMQPLGAAGIMAAEEGIRQKSWKAGVLGGLGAYGGASIGGALENVGEAAAPGISAAAPTAAATAPESISTNAANMGAGIGQLGTQAGRSAVAANLSDVPFGVKGALGMAAAPAIDASINPQTNPYTPPAYKYQTYTYNPGKTNPLYGKYSGETPLIGQGYSAPTEQTYQPPSMSGYASGGQTFIPAGGGSVPTHTIDQSNDPSMRAYYQSLLQPPTQGMPITPPSPNANQQYMAGLNQAVMPPSPPPTPQGYGSATGIGAPTGGAGSISGAGGGPRGGIFGGTAQIPNPSTVGGINTGPTYKYDPVTGRYIQTGSVDIPQGMASGGLPSLQPRMVHGPGDGMSDSIPAAIHTPHAKPQPAALGEGEFVVPADVVSHLGNGSTEAGAKHLYSMMDRVRRARTGKTGQAKAIHAPSLMPA